VRGGSIAETGGEEEERVGKEQPKFEGSVAMLAEVRGKSARLGGRALNGESKRRHKSGR